MRVIGTIASRIKAMFGGSAQADEPAEETAKAGEQPDEFSKSVDHIRATAKWTLLAFAAVGAILVAGSQLSNIGRFELNDWRLYLAVGALTIALLAVGVAIWFVIAVETSGQVTLQDLVDQEARPGSDEQRFLQRNRPLLAGYGSAGELSEEFQGYIDAQFRAIRAADQDAIDETNEWIVYLGRIIDQLLSAARYDRVQRTFGRWVWPVLIISILAGLSVGTFAWAANPPAKTPEPSDFRAPVRAILVPAGDEETRVNRIIGADCLATPIAAIVLRAAAGTAEVVSDPPDALAARCPVRRFTIDQRYVQPAQPVMQAP